jgi:hypothetical protein
MGQKLAAFDRPYEHSILWSIQCVDTDYYKQHPTSNQQQQTLSESTYGKIIAEEVYNRIKGVQRSVSSTNDWKGRAQITQKCGASFTSEQGTTTPCTRDRTNGNDTREPTRELLPSAKASKEAVHRHYHWRSAKGHSGNPAEYSNKTTTNPEGNNTLKKGNTPKAETIGNGEETTIRQVVRYPSHWPNWPGPNPVLMKPNQPKEFYLLSTRSKQKEEQVIIPTGQSPPKVISNDLMKFPHWNYINKKNKLQV